MKIISWNVAGLRAMIKKGHLQKMLDLYTPDVVCLQETKAEEHQVTLPEELTNKLLAQGDGIQVGRAEQHRCLDLGGQAFELVQPVLSYLCEAFLQR